MIPSKDQPGLEETRHMMADLGIDTRCGIETKAHHKVPEVFWGRVNCKRCLRVLWTPEELKVRKIWSSIDSLFIK